MQGRMETQGDSFFLPMIIIEGTLRPCTEINDWLDFHCCF